jgi:hypothetical protein
VISPIEIDLRIDELVLDGLPVTDEFALRNALRLALEKALRRAANHGFLAHRRNRDRVDGGEVTLAFTDAAGIGDALADSIVAAVRSSVSPPHRPEAS